jgi:hypothetical protein
MTTEIDLSRIRGLAAHGCAMSPDQARLLIKLMTNVFRKVMADAGHDRRQVNRITTKFRDAGRRSAPWKPTSSRVPGRPQDGADGNRILRWKLPQGHKFYADEVSATLVEVKYYLQALSLSGAPALPDEIRTSFSWVIEHPVEPGAYLDPIQLIPIEIKEVVKDARAIQSGHLIPLDRGGKHEPRNAFLMLARSNQLQGNLTVDELIKLMDEIVARHRKRARSRESAQGS